MKALFLAGGKGIRLQPLIEVLLNIIKSVPRTGVI